MRGEGGVAPCTVDEDDEAVVGIGGGGGGGGAWLSKVFDGSAVTTSVRT